MVRGFSLGIQVIKVFIIVCNRGFHIGKDPDESDAQSDNPKQNPSSKTEVQDEQFPFVAVHHFPTGLNTFIDGVFRMVQGDVVGHTVGEVFDDTRYKQQKGPEKRIKIYHKGDSDSSFVISHVREGEF